MNRIALSLAGFVLASGQALAQDCNAPAAPTLPDGASATLEEMLAGQQAVKDFQEANIAYLQCLDPLISAAAEKAAAKESSQEDRAAVKRLEKAYNAAVTQEQDLAGQFNTEIREYKAANPG